jgi:hypothetical protein
MSRTMRIGAKTFRAAVDGHSAAEDDKDNNHEIDESMPTTRRVSGSFPPPRGAFGRQ